MKTCAVCRSQLCGNETRGTVCNSCLDKHTKTRIRQAKDIARFTSKK